MLSNRLAPQAQVKWGLNETHAFAIEHLNFPLLPDLCTTWFAEFGLILRLIIHHRPKSTESPFQKARDRRFASSHFDLVRRPEDFAHEFFSASQQTHRHRP